MGLIDLINNLSTAYKQQILGKETTKIIKYSFVENQYDAIPSKILSNAVGLHNGIGLVNNHKLRELLIEALRVDDLNARGFNGNSEKIYDEAILKYRKDLDSFFKDFAIEDIYREQEVDDSRANHEFIKPIYGECNGKNAFPHPYQLRLKKEIRQKLDEYLNYDTKKILVTMPTGAGKTVLAMETIVDLLRTHYDGKPINIAWIVNSKELCEQSLQSFQKLWKQKGDRPVMAQRYFDRFNTFNNEDVDKITFASFQLLVPRINNNSKEDIAFISKLDYLFIDEAHFTGADQYRKIFETYQKNNNSPKIIGLTATPLRSDDENLNNLRGMFNNYYQLRNEKDKIVNSPIEYLVEREYLSNVDYNVINPSASSNKSNGFEYYKELHESVLKTCNNLKEQNKNTIIFAETKAHAIALSLFLKAKNIENGLIVGETPNQKRKDFLKKLGDKDDTLNVLVNEKILATGIDVPGLNSIIVLANIQSITTALQILGRAMRGPKNGGNKNNTIYITRDNKTKLENWKLLEEEALNK